MNTLLKRLPAYGAGSRTLSRLVMSLLLLLPSTLFGSMQVVGEKPSSVTDFKKLSILKSPNGIVGIEIDTRAGKLGYTVMFGKKPLAGWARIGLIADGADMGDGVTLAGKPAYTKHIERIKYRGNSSMVQSEYQQAIIPLHSGNSKEYNLEVRAYNDGIAWRLVMIGTGNHRIDGEPSGFSLPEGASVWFTTPSASYEGLYRQCSVADLKPNEQLMPPAVFRSEDGQVYGAISEANLSHFAGMRLLHAEKGMLHPYFHDEKSFMVNGNVTTPWRLMMLGKNLNALVNNSLIPSLSPRPDSSLANASWIKPSRLGWSWMAGGGAPGVNLDNMKRYARACADLGFEGNLVDEGWSHWGGGGEKAWQMVRELVRYSDSLGVKTWLWKACPDRAGIPGLYDPKSRDDFFRRCAELGIAGVKLDFLDSEGTKQVAFMEDALREAAKYKLMVVIHGCNKPTGTDYTWPNEMSREGIRGQEYGVNASLDQRHPFGRLLVGHGDYSPFWCKPSDTDANSAGTRPHNLATAIAYTSAVMLPCEHPELIRDMPEAEFFKSIPLTWDETVVLPFSEFGKCAAMARRNGTSWYVAITNDKEQRTDNLSLNFLGKGSWLAETYADNPSDRNQSVTGSKRVTAKDIFKVDMLSFGGWSARISKMALNHYGGTIASGERIVVTTASKNAAVHYTTDGSEPVASSPRYSEEGISLRKSSLLRIRIISGDGAGTELKYFYKIK